MIYHHDYRHHHHHDHHHHHHQTAFSMALWVTPPLPFEFDFHPLTSF
jgi:hypothetical protein